MKRRKKKSRRAKHHAGPKKRQHRGKKRARKGNPEFAIGKNIRWLPSKEASTALNDGIKSVRGLLEKAETPGQKNRIRVYNNLLYRLKKRWEDQTKKAYSAVKAGKKKGIKAVYTLTGPGDDKILSGVKSVIASLQSGADVPGESKQIKAAMEGLGALKKVIAKVTKKGTKKVAKKKPKKKKTSKKAAKAPKKKRAKRARKAKKHVAPKAHKPAKRKRRRKAKRHPGKSKRHMAAHHKIGEHLDKMKKKSSSRLRHYGRTYSVKRLNPSRKRKRNPGEAMIDKAKQVSASLVRKTGHSSAELGGLAVGGALIAVLPKLVDSVAAAIGMPSLSTYARSYYGNSVLIPLAIGMAVNHYAKGEKGRAVGSGIAAAAVVNAGIAATQYAASMAGMPLSGYIAHPLQGYVADSKTMRGMKKSIDFQGYKAFNPGSGDFNGMGDRYFGGNGYIASAVDYKGLGDRYFGGEYTDAAEENDPEDGAGSAQTG